MPNTVAPTPLSHGQLYSWREVESYPPPWRAEANLSATWDLRGLTPERLAAALRRLVELHEPLRTSYSVGPDGVPAQHVYSLDDDGPCGLDAATGLPRAIGTADRRITDFADPIRTTETLAGQAIPMTGGPCWRGSLVTTDGAPMFVSLAFSHLILDVWSMIELERRFRILAEDPEAGLDAGASQRDLSAAQHAEKWQTRQAAAEKYWRGVLAEAPARFRLRQALPTLTTGQTKPRVQAVLHSHRLTALAAEAARQHAVTVPAVLLAMVTAALAEHLGTEGTVISLMSNNRFAPDHRHVVGTLNQLIPISLPVDRAGTLAEHVKRTHWASAKAYRYSCYDVDRIAAQTEGSADGWYNRLFPAWFNYLPFDDRIADPAEYAPAELVWTEQPREYGQPFDVRVTAQDGRTSIQLRTDPEVVDAGALTGILRTIAFGVQRAVSAPESGLKELWTPADPDPALFPAV
ncbi:hypothetical protein ABH926_004902 [Catenulispora sp. GP43]|uniref:condensation domain-containing protein n=1 Tax=Catenulispora sp. GP43 TaxID=3156263 RepID=UPI0035122FA5